MTRFVNPYRQDSYRVLASTLSVSRLAMKAAYDAAYVAYVRCTDLLHEHMWSQVDTENVFEQLGLTLDESALTPRRPTKTHVELQEMYAESYAQDLQADYQAGMVLLFADDGLQRFAKGLLESAPGLGPSGYGRESGTHRGKVKLTAFLRAGTNAIRHVSEWDDYPWSERHPGVVYPDLADCRTDREREMISNIEIFQKVLGLGISERIREPLSMRVLIQVDGKLFPDSPMAYARFEKEVIAAAREIADVKGGEAPTRLEEQLSADEGRSSLQDM